MNLHEYSATGVIWDFDGTLLDSFGLQVSVLSEVLMRRGMPLPKYDVFVQNYHGRLIDSIRGICGVEGDLLQEIYEDFIQSEERHYEDPHKLFFPDALDLLQRNHSAGLQQIIVSNRPHHSDNRLGSPRNLARRAPLAGFIDSVVCGDDNEFHKPDPRMVDAAEKSLGLHRKDFLIVGDQFVDAEMAHNLGIQAVLVSRNEKDIVHLDRLGDGWESTVRIVDTLSRVSITKI